MSINLYLQMEVFNIIKYDSASKYYFSIIKDIVDAHPNLLNTFSEGQNILHYVCLYGYRSEDYFNIIKYLVEKNKKLISQKQYGNNHSNPLHIICEIHCNHKDSFKIIKYLIEKDENIIYDTNKYDKTPLHLIFKFGLKSQNLNKIIIYFLKYPKLFEQYKYLYYLIKNRNLFDKYSITLKIKLHKKIDLLKLINKHGFVNIANTILNIDINILMENYLLIFVMVTISTLNYNDVQKYIDYYNNITQSTKEIIKLYGFSNIITNKQTINNNFSYICYIIAIYLYKFKNINSYIGHIKAIKDYNKVKIHFKKLQSFLQ